MVKVFVTGATGQVGYNLVDYLCKDMPLGLNDPTDIICYIRNPRKASDLKKIGVTIKYGTLLDKEKIKIAMSDEEISYIFHIAANCNVGGSYSDYYKPNVIGTRNMLDSFINSNAKCFINTSSIAVYASFKSNESIIVVNEDSPIVGDDGDFYAISKKRVEVLIKEYSDKYPDKSFITTRLGPVVGPRDTQILSSFVTLLSFRNVPKLIGYGMDQFTVTPPLDIARAQVFLAQNSKKLSGSIYNVTGTRLRYYEIYNIICDYYSFKRPRFSIPMDLFLIFKPFLPTFKRLFPENDFLGRVFSEESLQYMGKTYIYETNKIEMLGFKFKVSPRETIIAGLDYLSKSPEYSKKKLKTIPYNVSAGEKHIKTEIEELTTKREKLSKSYEKNRVVIIRYLWIMGLILVLLYILHNLLKK